MAYDLGAITGKLTLESGGFMRGMLEAQNVSQTFGPVFTAAVTNPVLAGIQAFTKLGAGAVKGIEAAVGAATEMSDKLEKIGNLSERTGYSPKLIQGIQAAAKDIGENAEAAGDGLDFFNRTLGDAINSAGPARKAFENLGFDVRTFGKGDRDIYRVADALAAFHNPAERASHAMDFFGRGGVGLFSNLLGHGSTALVGYIKHQQDLGRIIGDDVVKAAAKYDAALDELNATLEGFKNKNTGTFLKGMVEGAGDGDLTKGPRELARVFNEEVGPAVRSVGQDVGVLSKMLSDLSEHFSDNPGAIKGAIMGLTPVQLRPVVQEHFERNAEDRRPPGGRR